MNPDTTPIFHGSDLNPELNFGLRQSSNQAQILTPVDCPDRWQAYRRLVELGLTCQCRAYQPLLVRVDSPGQLLQVWSILQTLSARREVLILHLDRCWSQPTF